MLVFKNIEIPNGTNTLRTHIVIFEAENSFRLLIALGMMMLCKFALTNSPWALLHG